MTVNLEEVIKATRGEIRRFAERHGASNVRVFGSVARGEARPESDVDLLVDVTSQTRSWFPTGLIIDLERLLGQRVEVVSEKALNKDLREKVLRSHTAMKDDAVYLRHVAERWMAA